MITLLYRFVEIIDKETFHLGVRTVNNSRNNEAFLLEISFYIRP